MFPTYLGDLLKVFGVISVWPWLGPVGIEIGSVILHFAKPFSMDTLYVSRHRHANWLSEPPKNDARRNVKDNVLFFVS